MTIHKVLFTLSLGLVLLGCANAPKIDPAMVNATTNYYPAKVSITQSAGFSTGLAAIGSETSQQLANQFSAETQARLAAELPRVLHGKQPANIVVLLKQADIASEVGRAMMATDSYVDATVSIIDVASGATISATNVHAVDQASRGSGDFNGIPIGALVNLAVNSASSSKKERIGRITTAFIEEVKKQLGAK